MTTTDESPSRFRCYQVHGVVLELCATQSIYSLHIKPTAPLPLPPPPDPPAPPFPPFAPGFGLSRDECGLPAYRWRLEANRYCPGDVLFRNLQDGLYPRVSTLEGCKAACLAVGVAGDTNLQTRGTHYGHDRISITPCRGFTLSKEATDAKCYLLAGTSSSGCKSDAAFDTYSLTTSPLPAEARDPSFPPAHEHSTASFHAWWNCHLLEGGGIDDFTQLTASFASESELRASEWWSYFETIYGSETLVYPLHVGALTYFHNHLLPPGVMDGLDHVPQDYGGYPAVHFPDLLRWGDFAHGLYCLHKGDFWRFWRHVNSECPSIDEPACRGLNEVVLNRGAPDHSLIEVQHMCCDGLRQGGSTRIGFWHYLAPGSGIFFNVGKTFATNSHATMREAVKRRTGCDAAYLANEGISTAGATFDISFECLRLLGYNSIQFTHHMEHSFVLFEVVHLNDMHDQAGDSCYAPEFEHKYRKGFDGSRPCNCKHYPGRSWSGLNCDGPG